MCYNMQIFIMQFEYSGSIGLIKGEGNLEFECGPAWFFC